MMIIRNAHVQDVQSIARVHVDCWRTTYKEILPEEYLLSLSYKEREELWEVVIPRGGVFVAEVSGEVVGFASAGKERSGKYKDYEGELYAIYILEAHQKNGVGKALVKEIIHDLKEQDIHSMLVWVIEDNPSCAFYQSLGGTLVDKVQDKIGGIDVHEVLYGWKDI